MKVEILNLNEFILYDSGLNKGRIDWKANIKLIVRVFYKDKEYTIKITDYNEKENKVTFTYLDKIQKPMFIGHFMKCKFGNVFKEKKYIRDKIEETQYEIDYDRCYKELRMTKDMVDDLTFGTEIKIFVKCKKCGMRKENSIVFSNIYRRNQKCEYCSGGVSYSERYFRNIMNQLGENYIKTKFKWSNNREYDGYFERYSLCIELHGNQHYQKGFDTLGGHDVIYEKANDRYKKHIAKQNGIENYIQIDCKYSNPIYIKNNIIKSLSWLFNFNNIDWNKAHKECENSIIFEICNMWMSIDKLNRSVSIIAESFNLSVDTIRIYLKRGKMAKWCDYDGKEERNKGLQIGRNKSKKIICITTGIIYNSMSKIEELLKIPCSNISKCCHHKYGFKTAGGYEWEFVANLTEEQIKLIQENAKLNQAI